MIKTFLVSFIVSQSFIFSLTNSSGDGGLSYDGGFGFNVVGEFDGKYNQKKTEYDFCSVFFFTQLKIIK
jgi:hypothetical protein